MLPGDSTLGAIEVGVGAFGIAATAAAGWVYSALSPGSQLFGKTVIAGDDPQEFALTYDDGPNTAVTPELLDLLAEHGVQATFFLIGKFVREQPELTRRIAAAGHVVGNHTMTHPWLSSQSPARVREEMTECNHLLEDTLGSKVRLFRPPHGARRPAVFEVAAELGLKIVQWNALGYDWMPRTSEQIVASVTGGVERNQRQGRGSNILLHDGGQLAMGQPRLPTVAATRTLITVGRNAGARFVTPLAWL